MGVSVLFKNKWVTLALVIFIVYSYLNQSPRKTGPQNLNSPSVNSEAKENLSATDIVNFVKEQGKTVEPAISEGNNLKKTSSGPIATTLNKDAGFIEKKVVSLVNNLIETEAGKQVIDKIMSTATSGSEVIDFTTDPYLNRTAIDAKIGEGKPAMCGQTVTINYLAKTTSGKVIENTKEKNNPKTITLGKGSVIKGLEYSIIGMRKGGLRSSTIQPSYAYDDIKFASSGVDKTSFVGLEIELIDLSPDVTINEDKIQIFEKIIGERNTILKCGDTASINYRIKKVDGTLLYDSSSKNNVPKILTIGDGSVPFIINRMLENMGQNASRTAIVPLDALNNMTAKKTSFFPDNIAFPKHELIIVEVDTVKP